MGRVTGIGGVFLKSSDPKALSAWYAEHLGVVLNDWGGAAFSWSDEVPPTTGTTAWSVFPADSKYFGPGTEAGAQTVMIDYRVDDLDGLLAQLEAAGVWIDPKRDEAGFGKFAWIKDLDGNRVELWQPLVEPPTE
jgi:predicted enzyme related to lactoylglutathione lyase